MTQTDAYPLNERQLELVFNLPYYAALYMFKEPLTPSESLTIEKTDSHDYPS